MRVVDSHAVHEGDDGWVQVARSDDLPLRGIHPVTIGERELVLWRAAHGPVCASNRACPHLDADLAEEGVVDGDELVCGAHFWRIDRQGRISKLNIRGRRDPKGSGAPIACREMDDVIQVRLLP